MTAAAAPTPRWWEPRFVLALGAVATAAAGFAIAFRASVNAAVAAVGGASSIVIALERAAWWWRLAFPALGALAAGALVRLIARRRSSGTRDVMEAVALGATRLSLGVTVVKSLASWCAIACGNSLGREGPLIQFGGAVGQDLGERFGVDPVRLRVLIAAGTAAGFAAAYNTPLAAVVFVLEVVAGIAVVDAIVPTLVATVIATALTRAVVGAGPIYGQRVFSLAHAGELVAYAAVGLIAAAVAIGFRRLVALAERAFHQPWLAPPWRQALGGLAAGAVIAALPVVAGNGYEPLNDLLGGALPIGLVAVVLVAKCVATSFTVGSGNPGGVFTPTLLVGGCTGYLIGLALGAAGLDVAPPGSYALIGMSAAIAAAMRAPLMAAILGFELSGDYAVVLPLVLATALARVAADLGASPQDRD